MFLLNNSYILKKVRSCGFHGHPQENATVFDHKKLSNTCQDLGTNCDSCSVSVCAWLQEARTSGGCDLRGFRLWRENVGLAVVANSTTNIYICRNFCLSGPKNVKLRPSANTDMAH